MKAKISSEVITVVVARLTA